MGTKETIIELFTMAGAVIGLIATIIFFIYVVCETYSKISNFFIYYRSFRENPFIKEDSVTMTIKDLKKLYKVNPSKWEVDESCGFKTLCYKIPTERVEIVEEPSYYWYNGDWTHRQEVSKAKKVVTQGTKKIYIYFNLPQYIWFLFNNKFRKSLKARSMESENLRLILTDCQNDIDAIKAAADAQLQSALDTMKDVNIRLENEGKENE